ncbi:uncharacterized protein MONBRDRAFT_38068 [Monosiga brevicollis MX1]|uniref:PH domain-containing protein n=1 Tax=Monosiga brevicollis TaxID=81824 RepID=A9V5H8_MONBE|nr:uncharacterized protein MONBRDRAFT_38068 [Monosiga brevicollis MX1]EDQ87372.1 predicted protein [Monosiga brevicollis MX1]|eukprot:XP_001747985.1 hypothetical protein [Monosiga brevicollis MX1]
MAADSVRREPVLEEWLEKQGHVNTGWKSRYFELRDSMVTYRQARSDAMPKGQFDIQGATVQLDEAPDAQGRHRLHITVPAGKRVYHLRGSKDRMRLWQAAILRQASPKARADSCPTEPLQHDVVVRTSRSASGWESHPSALGFLFNGPPVTSLHCSCQLYPAAALNISRLFDSFLCLPFPATAEGTEGDAQVRAAIASLREPAFKAGFLEKKGQLKYDVLDNELAVMLRWSLFCRRAPHLPYLIRSSSRAWQQRWVEIRAARLEYYKVPTDVAPKGDIWLKGAHVAINRITNDSSTTAQNMVYLEISPCNETRVYRFRASASLAQEWLVALQERIESLKSKAKDRGVIISKGAAAAETDPRGPGSVDHQEHVLADDSMAQPATLQMELIEDDEHRLAESQERIAHRNEQIRLLEQDMSTINSIMRDTSDLLTDQREHLDHIESVIDRTHSAVTAGMDDLHVAHKRT